MGAPYQVSLDSAQLFEAADARYSAIKARLVSAELASSTDPEAQRVLAHEQKELMRLLYQAWLELQGRAVPVAPVVDADGNEHTQVKHGTSRKLESVFGTVTVPRSAYTGRGLSELHPVDSHLNLLPTKYSLEVERQFAQAVATQSFDEALATVTRTTGAHIPKRQAEEATRRSASDFDWFYATSTMEFDGPTSNLLVLSFDQKGVVLRLADLTTATRQAAEGSQAKLETRTSKGEPRRGRKRMAMVAAVYTVAPYRRTAMDIMAGLRHLCDAKTKPRPRPEGKRVWATLERSPEEVIADAFDEAELRDPGHDKRWLVLVDGDKKLATYVRAEAQRRGVEVTVVLDFIHALEYLWKAGHAFFDEGSRELENWVLERLERILNGQVSNVVAGMTRMATRRELGKTKREPVDKAARYFLRRKQMMQYGDLLRIGAPIATGVIEGACRHLINDRMDITGARWSLSGAEAVLRLRSLRSSGDFDEYWAFHEEQEMRRNHARAYANSNIPAIQRPTGAPQLRVVEGGR